jgi:hypothetical protein
MINRTFEKLAMPMDEATWWKEAERAAQWFWAYDGLVEDAREDLEHLRLQDTDPYDAIKGVGQELDLHEFGPAFGGW